MQSGYIYKICCNLTGETYYGSTEMTMEERISLHISNAEGNSTKKCTSAQIFERGDWSHEIVEEVDYIIKTDLLIREAYYIKNYPCINITIPYRTKEEKREYDKLKRRRYRLNPEYARREKEHARIKHICPCGSSYSNDSRAEHFRTKKHQRYIDNN